MDVSEERVPLEQLAGTSQEPKEEPPKVFKFTQFDDEQARQRLWLGMEQPSPIPEWEQLRRVTENFKTRHVALLLPEDPTETRVPLIRPKPKPKESKNETQRAADGTLKVDKNITERVKSSIVVTKKMTSPKIKKSSPIKNTSENKVRLTTVHKPTPSAVEEEMPSQETVEELENTVELLNIDSP